MATRFMFKALATAALGISLSPLLAATTTTSPARSNTTAEVAPSVSPFAGTYRVWAGLTISDGGRITASYDDPNEMWRITIRGRVSNDGRYSYTQTLTTFDFFHRRLSQSSVQHAGTMALDDAGNIVGRDNTGGLFIWLRY